MTETYLNILTKEDFEKRVKPANTESRFVLEANLAVFNHLEDMFNEHVKRTDKILVGGDCVLSLEDMNVLLELIEIEEGKLAKMFLDSWEFQVRPKVKFLNYNEVKDEANYDQTKAYLAKKAMLNSNYEIRKGQLGNYEFEIDKQWQKVSKRQIEKYLFELKSLVKEAVTKKLIITSTYY